MFHVVFSAPSWFISARCQNMWKSIQALLFKTGQQYGRAPEQSCTPRGSTLWSVSTALLWLLLCLSSCLPSLRCRSQWCCRALAVLLPELRSSQSRLTETDPVACPLLSGSPAVALGCCCPGGRCSRWVCCSCCSAVQWWRCPSELSPSVTLPPSETPVLSGQGPR